ITSIYVVLVPLAHSAITRRLPGLGLIAGVILAFVGLALLTGQTSLTGMNRGDVWTLACSAAFAIHIILVGRFSHSMRPLDFVTGQVVAATVLGAVIFPWAEQWHMKSSATVWAAILITGLLCTALGIFVQAWAQRSTSPSRAALIFSGEPVFAWITSALVLNE